MKEIGNFFINEFHSLLFHRRRTTLNIGKIIDSVGCYEHASWLI